MGLRGLIAALLICLPGLGLACEGTDHRRSDFPQSLDTHDGIGISAAWFDDATTRYTHAILGDGVEAGSLHAVGAACETLSVTLDADHVFEDLAPRLHDLDGDGRAEIIVVRTHVDLGGQLAIYGAAGDGETLRLIAATPYIGQTRRWLAPIGVADLDGDGAQDIAYIDRPHLARILRVWRFADGTLTQIAAAQGLTNHRIGEDVISGGIRHCGDGPEIVTANADWSRVIVTTLDAGGTLTGRDVAAYTQATLRAVLGCRR